MYLKYYQQNNAMKILGIIICLIMSAGACYEATKGYYLLYPVSFALLIIAAVLFIYRNK